MKVSLRLILIEDADGAGVNVKPLAQQELLKTEIFESEDFRLFLANASRVAQAAIKKDLYYTPG